jgi:WD40 repeat protein
MLTGQPPIRGSSNVEVLRRVTTERPVPVRQLSPDVPQDLEAICARCIEKNPGNRYASAAQLADDLGRYLRGEPTTVRPDTAWRATRRWMRRNPTQAGLIGLLALTLLVLIGGLFAYNQRLQRLNTALQEALADSRRAEDIAQATSRRTEQMLYASDMTRAARAWKEGDYRNLHRILQRHLPETPCSDDRGFEWWWFWDLVHSSYETIAVHHGSAYFVTFSPDQRWIASAGQDAVVRLTATAQPRSQRELPTGQGEVNSVAFTSDGARLATAGDDGTVRVWDWQSSEPHDVLQIQAHESLAFGVLFARDDGLLITCGDDPVIRLWDAVSGQSAGSLSGHERAVEQIALSPDGRILASAGRDGSVMLWDLETRQRLQVLPGDIGRLTSVAFSPDGMVVAAGSVEGTVCLWNIADGSRVASYQHLDGVHCLVFSPDGHWLYACDRGGIIRSWPATAADATPGQRPEVRDLWTAHNGRVYSLALSREGQRLVSAGEDGFVRLWTPALSESVPVVNTEKQQVDEFFFSPHGDSILGVSAEGINRWELVTGEQSSVCELLAPGRGAAMSAEGNRLVLGEPAGTVRLYDCLADRMEPPWTTEFSSEVEPLCFLNAGHELALIDEEHEETILVYTCDGGLLRRIPAEPYCTLAAASPDGTWLAFDVLNDVMLWDLVRNRPLFRLQGHQSTVTAIRFHPDGRQLVTASKDRTVKIWDIRTGQLRFSCAGHRSVIHDAAVSPDGRTIASCDHQGAIKLWHTATGQELCNLRDESQPVRQIAFAPDGSHLGYLLNDHRILVLSVDLGDPSDGDGFGRLGASCERRAARPPANFLPGLAGLDLRQADRINVPAFRM